MYDLRVLKQRGFSLMEMMIVLLIISIVAAATAPMITKKMARSAGSNDSPWVFTGMDDSIAFNMSGDNDATVVIGATSLPRGWDKKARLFIDCGNNDNVAHVAYGNGETEPFLLTADPARGRVGFSNEEIPQNSVAFGSGQTLNGTSSVTIGFGASTNSNSVAIGAQANANDTDAVAIGRNSVASDVSAIAIGSLANASGENAIAFGSSAKASD